MEIEFGPYAIPVILTVILGIIYKFVSFSDKYKALIAVIIGVGLGILAIPYKALPWTVVSIVDHMIYGLMTGASAVGLWELSRTAIKPRL